MPNGPESLICEDCRSVLNWSSDSKAVLVVAGDRDRPVLVSLATREKRVLTEHPKYPLHDYVLSRDQRWLAFRVIESLNSQPVYISPVHSDKPYDRIGMDPGLDERSAFPSFLVDRRQYFVFLCRKGQLRLPVRAASRSRDEETGGRGNRGKAFSRRSAALAKRVSRIWLHRRRDIRAIEQRASGCVDC